MSVIVAAKQLGRWYGEVVGLNDLTVKIEEGITGLIGPNGAGKSTFMKMSPNREGRSSGFKMLIEVLHQIRVNILRSIELFPAWEIIVQ